MLPTCPACKQSVLDDDATECPFCGANMKTGKGGNGGKSAPPPKAAPKSSAAPASAGTSKPASSAGKSSTGKSSTGSSRKSSLDDDDDPFSAGEDDDDPFAAATKEAAASKANAIAVSPRKTKTHQVELKCPMCDTEGFVPEKSGGKDVKCCNPNCRVPIFMAPKNLAPPVIVTDPKTVKVKKATGSGPTKMPLILAIVGGVALVAVVGGGVYFWDSMTSAPEPTKRFTAGTGTGTGNPVGPAVPTDAGNSPHVTGTNTDDPNATNTAAAVVTEQLDVPKLLKLMQDHSLEEKLVNKKYCRQLTAIGYALTGDIEGMTAQFKALEQIENSLQHFKIPASLALGWHQLAKGDKPGADKTAAEAVAATVNVGKGSRDTQEPVLDLSAFLAATGKADAGKKILAENMKFDSSTPLVVASSLSRHRKDFDLSQELPGVVGNPHPAWPDIGVTLILTTEGFWTEAEQWAASIPNVEAKTDCLVAWADAKLRDALAKKQPSDTLAEGAAAKLSPGGKVQLLARLALTQAKAGNTAEAERLIAAAQETLKSITVPAIARCDGFKEALDWKPPEALGLRQAALGAAVIGLAQAQLKKLDEGWVSTVEALKYTRGVAPSPPAVAKVKEAAEELGPEGLREKIRMLLNLRARDEAVRKTRDLQNKLDDIEKLATARFHLQEAIMIHAAAGGMAKLAWQEALSLSQRPDPNEHEPYLTGRLPAHLIHQFNKEGHEAEAAEVTSKIDQGELPADEVFELQQIVDAALQANNFGDAIAAFNQRKLSGGAEEVALRGFIRAAKREGQALATLTLADSLDTRSQNQFVKLEALRMLAAFTVHQTDPIKVRATIQGQKLTNLEKISAYLGLIEGDLAHRPDPAPAASAPAAEGAPVNKGA